jgi:signal transduction histidine kinase
MQMWPPENEMDRPPRHRGAEIALAAALGIALIGGAAVVGIRYVLRQDVVDSAEAQTVIRVAKLSAAAERLGGHARGFLLTADPGTFERVTADRDTFFARLGQLLDSSDGSTRQRLNEVRAAATEYDEALEGVLGQRRRDESSEMIAQSFEHMVRPRKANLDAALVRLVNGEEARLRSLDRSTEREASLLATTTSGVALGALFVSVILALKLARTFGSLRNKQVELEATMEQLRRANGDLEAFAGRIAHDLRTPLTPITLMAASLMRSTDDRVVRAAERIERSASRASHMVEDLLAFSRLGRRDEQASTAAGAAVRATIDDFSERLAADEITLELALDADATVACSESLFRQVVSNLVGNALKFVKDRNERRVQVRLQTRDRTCQLEVQDTGPGIPADAISRIFDPFFRVPGNETPGSGLGLAIVRRIVDAHDGSVTVQSVLGQGCTFRVVLPSAPVRNEERTALPLHSETVASSAG